MRWLILPPAMVDGKSYLRVPLTDDLLLPDSTRQFTTGEVEEEVTLRIGKVPVDEISEG